MTPTLDERIREIFIELYQDRHDRILKFGLENEIENATQAIKSLILEERINGAKAYNRIITDYIGKEEYIAIGLDGIVGIYRQSVVGEAIRKANATLIEVNPQAKEK